MKHGVYSLLDFNSSKKYDEEMKVIEAELQDYLYDFPYILNNKVEDTIEF